MHSLKLAALPAAFEPHQSTEGPQIFSSHTGESIGADLIYSAECLAPHKGRQVQLSQSTWGDKMSPACTHSMLLPGFSHRHNTADNFQSNNHIEFHAL